MGGILTQGGLHACGLCSQYNCIDDTKSICGAIVYAVEVSIQKERD